MRSEFAHAIQSVPPVRKHGSLYKEMQLKDRLPVMSGDEQLKLLATNGMLVKRPLLIDGDIVLVGFREIEWSDKLIDYFSEE